MASNFLIRKTNITHDTKVHLVESTIAVTAAGTKNYTVDMEPGLYRILVCVSSSLTGSTTTLGAFRRFTDLTQSQLDAAANSLRMLSPATAATALKTYTLAAAANGAAFEPNHNGTSNIFFEPISTSILSGFRFTLTNGTSKIGEKCQIVVVSTKL